MVGVCPLHDHYGLFWVCFDVNKPPSAFWPTKPLPAYAQIYLKKKTGFGFPKKNMLIYIYVLYIYENLKSWWHMYCTYVISGKYGKYVPILAILNEKVIKMMYFCTKIIKNTFLHRQNFPLRGQNIDFMILKMKYIYKKSSKNHTGRIVFCLFQS